MYKDHDPSRRHSVGPATHNALPWVGLGTRDDRCSLTALRVAYRIAASIDEPVQASAADGHALVALPDGRVCRLRVDATGVPSASQSLLPPIFVPEGALRYAIAMAAYLNRTVLAPYRIDRWRVLVNPAGHWCLAEETEVFLLPAAPPPSCHVCEGSDEP